MSGDVLQDLGNVIRAFFKERFGEDEPVVRGFITDVNNEWRSAKLDCKEFTVKLDRNDNDVTIVPCNPTPPRPHGRDTSGEFATFGSIIENELRS